MTIHSDLLLMVNNHTVDGELLQTWLTFRAQPLDLQLQLVSQNVLQT